MLQTCKSCRFQFYCAKDQIHWRLDCNNCFMNKLKKLKCSICKGDFESVYNVKKCRICYQSEQENNNLELGERY
jgi:hypothetical protein